MGKYQQRNSQVIEKAFAKLRANEEQVIRNGMYGLLEDAVKYALEIHDATHSRHLDFGDTYAWMLVHDGRIEEVVATAGKATLQGEATRQIEAMLPSVSKTGWVGVVMAGLSEPVYFSVDYEQDILNDTVSHTREGFSKYFKPIG